MPLTAAQNLSPQVPNSLTALLQGSGQALTGALSNAVQLGRDAVNNQVQQERSLLTEQRAEINLANRRSEQGRDQFNRDRSFARDVLTSDRAFGENQRQFNALDADRDASRGIQARRSDLLNRGTLLDIGRKQAELDAYNSPEGVEIRKNLSASELLKSQTALTTAQADADSMGKRIELGNAKVQAEIDELGGLSEEQTQYVETLNNARANAERLRATGSVEAADALDIEVGTLESGLPTMFPENQSLVKSLVEIPRVDDRTISSKQLEAVTSQAADERELKVLSEDPKLRETMLNYRNTLSFKRDPNATGGVKTFGHLPSLKGAANESNGDPAEFKRLVDKIASDNGLKGSLTIGQAAKLLKFETALAVKSRDDLGGDAISTLDRLLEQ
jgi:hypothetical protein